MVAALIPPLPPPPPAAFPPPPPPSLPLSSDHIDVAVVWIIGMCDLKPGER